MEATFEKLEAANVAYVVAANIDPEDNPDAPGAIYMDGPT